jgi:hypothetical protein
MADVMYFNEMEREWGGVLIRPFTHLPIREYLKLGDVPYRRPGTESDQDPSKDSKVPSLQQLAFKAASPSSWTRQKLVLSSTANLHEEGAKKLVDIMTTYCKPVRGLQYKLSELSHLMPKAIDIVTHMCGGTPEIGLHHPEVDLSEILQSVNLSTAAGINGYRQEVDTVQGVPVEENPNGIKYDFFPAAATQFMEWILDSKRPFVNFSVSTKVENVFMDSESDLERKKEKARIFVIPNLVLILIEHIVGICRKLELGGSIGIGRTWTRGGMDALLKMMGIENPELYDLNEGDVTKIDQSIADVLINLFFSSRLQYFDPKGPDYEVAERTIRLLIEEFTQKLTFVMGEIWAIVCGGVPSGSLHTSHMDSWCLLFLFVMFCLHTAETCPHLQREIEIALMIKIISIVVYGDDNWYFTPKHLTPYLGVKAWKRWMKKFVGIKMRDTRSGHPLVSVPKDGFFEVKGGVYLRHYCVANPHSGEDQPKYVPYRPMKEIVLKTVYGREPKLRDPVNLVLSILGHVYGTYGSNPFTYRWLWCMYRSALLITGKPFEYFSEQWHTSEKELLRKSRQLGVGINQLLMGFPSISKLVEMNRYDPSAHTTDAISMRAAATFTYENDFKEYI